MPYPSVKNKYGSHALIQPGEFLKYQINVKKKPFKVPQGVILCYNRKLMEHVMKKYKTKSVRGFPGRFELLADMNYRVGVIGNFGVGAPVTATIVEELVALGVRKFIALGMAGTLQKNLPTSSISVCERAIRDEGTSYHYLPPSKYVYASKQLVRDIEDVLRRKAIVHFKGTTWTIDAPYRETAVEIKKYQKEGVLTVEMEAAALFAVAKFRAVEAAAIFTISDHLGEFEWKPKFHLAAKALQNLFGVALEVLSQR